MDSNFGNAVGALCDGDVASLERLLKQNPRLVKVRRRGRSLLTFAILNDRLRATQLLHRRGFALNEEDENGESALHWAVHADARKCAKYILGVPREAGDVPWVLLKDHHKVTAIHLAAKLGRSKLLRIFVASMSDCENFYVEAMDSVGQSPLHYAAACGRLECCEILLDERLGLPIDQKDCNGHTPLMCAAASFYSAGDVVRALGLRKGISVTFRDNEGRTALHLAIISANIAVVKVLLEQLSCPPETFDKDGRTPLHYAALRGQLDAVELLLKAKANNATRDCFGVSPAHYAAQRGHLAVLDRILSSTGGVDQYDGNGRSCFMWAVVADQLEMVQQFLSRLQPDRSHRDNYGYTALHHAAHVGSSRLVKLLVKEGWSIHEGDSSGATPLHIAAGRGFTDVVRLLMMVGAIGEHPDRHCRTPIFYACLGGQAHTLKVMLTELDCKGSHADRLGRTALHCAAFGGFVACIEVLIFDSDCAVHAEDVEQLTALHVACEQGKLDCAKRLLELGAAVNALSHVHLCTPLSSAHLNGHHTVADFLQRHGGLFPNRLRELSAVIIQKWWRKLSRKKRKTRLALRRGPSPPRTSSIRRFRYNQP